MNAGKWAWLTVIMLFMLILAVGSVFYAWFVWSELKELRKQNRELVESMQPSGGTETAIEKPVPLPGYRFPIHEADYLMLTSAFGYRISPIYHVAMNHSGLDIAGVWRAQTVAVEDGKVVEHWPPPGTRSADGRAWRGHPTRGGYIVIQHENGVMSSYSHLAATYVREGQEVKAGQVIGRVGDTGLATGPHLHFEMLINEKPVNPLLYIRGVE